MSSRLDSMFAPPEDFGIAISESESWSLEEYYYAQAESQSLRSDMEEAAGNGEGPQLSDFGLAALREAYDRARLKETVLYIACHAAGKLDAYPR